MCRPQYLNDGNGMFDMRDIIYLYEVIIIPLLDKSGVIPLDLL